MDVRFVGANGVESHDVAGLAALLERADGFTWVDIPAFDEAAASLLRETFQCHPAVIDACARRNHVPSVHAYEHQFFTILHAPLLGKAGHVHLLELDQLVGLNYVITVHGPINPALDPSVALAETESV